MGLLPIYCTKTFFMPGGGVCATLHRAQAACYKRYLFSTDAKQEKKCAPLFARWIQCLEEAPGGDAESVRAAVGKELASRKKFQGFGRRQCGAR